MTKLQVKSFVPDAETVRRDWQGPRPADPILAARKSLTAGDAVKRAQRLVRMANAVLGVLCFAGGCYLASLAFTLAP